MIQPIDIKTQKFKKGLLGYKASDVDNFIDAVYKAYDELYTKNAELSGNLEKLNASLQENRLKMFELENKVQKYENVSSYDDDNEDAKKKADEIIKNAEKAAAEIIKNAKAESGKIENFGSVKVEPVSDEPVKQSASSRFFKKAEEDMGSNTASSTADDDDDEIFVGEIEDNRKKDRVMIGDGEEEEDMDFEFL